MMSQKMSVSFHLVWCDSGEIQIFYVPLTGFISWKQNKVFQQSTENQGLTSQLYFVPVCALLSGTDQTITFCYNANTACKVEKIFFWLQFLWVKKDSSQNDKKGSWTLVGCKVTLNSGCLQTKIIWNPVAMKMLCQRVNMCSMSKESKGGSSRKNNQHEV